MARRYLNAYNDWYIGGTRVARLNTRPRADGYPMTAVKRVGGGRSLPEADEALVDTPSGRRGEIPYPRTTRGKTLSYELQARALTEPSLNGEIEDLAGAFSDRSSVGLLVLEPWPGHGTDQWATFARVLDFDCDDQLVYPAEDASWPHSEWMLDPILALRQLDGRWLWWNESGTPGTAMSWSGVSTVSVTNSGNAPVEPHIEVTGVAAGTDLHIFRDVVAGSAELWLRDPVAAAGLTGTRTVVIDFPSRSVTVLGNDATASYDASASTWWDEFSEGVPPGTWTLERGPGAGTGISVSFWSASW